MIIVISLCIFLIINQLRQNKNYINLFHKSKKFVGLIVFTLEGIFYLSIYYSRLKHRCKNVIFTDMLLLMGVFSILLGISLVLMRLVNITFYSMLFYLVMTVIIITVFTSMKINFSENFTNKCYFYDKKASENCITISKYKDKCISKDYILNNKFSKDQVELNNIKKQLIKEILENKKKEDKKIENEKELYKKKCKNINNLNKTCNEECKKGNKYLCNRFLTNNPENYVSNELIDCSKYDIEGYMISSCKPYIPNENETECIDELYYRNNTFNKNNLLIRGENECNKKGLGVKNFKSCPYDSTKVLFECDKNYMNGEPIENNKELNFINHY